MHKSVFSADIVQMFLQICVVPEHRNFKRIVCRDAPSDPPQQVVHRLLLSEYWNN